MIATAIIDALDDGGLMSMSSEELLESFEPELEIELDEGRPAANNKTRYQLTISVPPNLPRTSRGRNNPGVVTIKTNHPSGQEIQMQLTLQSF